MADLGSIDYTEESRGTREVDRSYQARAIAQGLDIGKTVFDESVKKNVTNDMMSAIEAIDNTVNTDINPTITYGEGTRERYLANKIDKLKGVIAQGTTNQRDLAEMQVKTILAEAQEKYPWLYTDLQQRAGMVLAGSAKLDELGIGDSARKEAASQAQTVYDEMIKFSTDPWKDDGTGGLGMDPALVPGTPQWNQQYAYRSKLRTEVVNQQIQTAMAMSNAAGDLNDDTYYNSLLSNLSGRYSLQAGAQEAIRNEFEYYKLLKEVHKGKQGDINYIRDWKQLYGDQMGAYVAQKKAELTTFFLQAVPPDQEGSQRGQLLRKRFDDLSKQYDALDAAIKADLEDLPDAVRFAESVMAATQFVQYQNLSPESQSAFDFVASPVGETLLTLFSSAHFPNSMSLMEKVQKLGTNIFLEGTSSFIGPSSTDTNKVAEAYNMSPGLLNITPNMSWSQINSKIKSRQANPGDNYIVETKTPQDEALASLSSIDLGLGIWRTALAEGAFATPAMAGTSLTGLNYGLNTLVTQDQNFDGVNEEVLSELASPELYKAVETAGDTEFKNQRIAFGHTAQDYYAKTRPTDRRVEVKAAYQDTYINTQPLSELVLIDVNGIKNGQFRWVVQEGPLKKAIADEQARLGASRPSGRAGASEARTSVMRKIEEVMGPIGQEVTQQIAIEGMLDRATSPSVDQRRRGPEFRTYFLGMGDDSPIIWSSIFNYTEGSMY